MSNAIEKRESTQLAQSFGERQAIEEMRNRIATMIPGAVEAPADVVWAAAQLSVAHKLNPFNGEIYIMPVGRKKTATGAWVEDYRVHIGVKGLRKKAREQANFMTEFRDLDPAEVKRLRREDYDANDVGVECTLFRLDVATQCKHAGIPYCPTRAVGIWRQKAQFHRKDNEWKPDGIPNTWTAQQVAKKRAEINAIKEAFDVQLDVADPSVSGDDVVEAMAYHVAHEDRENAMMIVEEPLREEDGGILFAVESQPAQSTPTASPQHANGAHNGVTVDDAPLVEVPPDDHPFEDDAHWRQWSNVKQACEWGQAQGVFNAYTHAKNAYELVKNTYTEQCAEAGETVTRDGVFKAWQDDVLMRVEVQAEEMAQAVTA